MPSSSSVFLLLATQRPASCIRCCYHKPAACSRPDFTTTYSPGVGRPTFSLKVAFSFQEHFHLILSKLLMEMCIEVRRGKKNPVRKRGQKDARPAPPAGDALRLPSPPSRRWGRRAACTPPGCHAHMDVWPLAGKDLPFRSFLCDLHFAHSFDFLSPTSLQQ